MPEPDWHQLVSHVDNVKNALYLENKIPICPGKF